eukprot:jgi/Mesvir1/12068/Mv00352-RA.1
MATSFVGKVVSDKMQKSILVLVDRFTRNKKYDKVIRHTKKFMAHDENEECRIGDKVRINSCRPLSKRKSFVVAKILQRELVFDFENNPPPSLDELRARDAAKREELVQAIKTHGVPPAIKQRQEEAKRLEEEKKAKLHADRVAALRGLQQLIHEADHSNKS